MTTIEECTKLAMPKAQMKSNGVKNLLTPLEVAKTLQLNTLTIYNYIKNKKLLAIKIGRNYRIDKKDLEEFIKSHKTY